MKTVIFRNLAPSVFSASADSAHGLAVGVQVQHNGVVSGRGADRAHLLSTDQTHTVCCHAW